MLFSYHPIASLQPTTCLLNVIWSIREDIPWQEYFRCTKQDYALMDHSSIMALATGRHTPQLFPGTLSAYFWLYSLFTNLPIADSILYSQMESSPDRLAQVFTQSPNSEDIYMETRVVHFRRRAMPTHRTQASGHNPLHQNTVWPDTSSVYGIRNQPMLVLQEWLYNCPLHWWLDTSTLNHIATNLHDKCTIRGQGSIQDFLGVHMYSHKHKHKHSRMHFKQLGILANLNHTNCHQKFTKANYVLHPDHDRHSHIESWNCHSVIHKLNYIAQMMCPDISMVVCNCAHFPTTPTYLQKQDIK
jgi:hypothetical protein